jgi:hypothetical protein
MRLRLALEIAGLIDRGSILRKLLIFDQLYDLENQLTVEEVATAKNKGGRMDWWEMAAYLLEVLPELGWGSTPSI